MMPEMQVSEKEALQRELDDANFTVHLQGKRITELQTENSSLRAALHSCRQQQEILREKAEADK